VADLVQICVEAQQAMFARGDVDAVERYTTDDVVSHTTPDGTPGGRDGIKGVIRWIHSGLEDVTYEVQDAFASGDRVMVRTEMSGTHARPWMGREPTGRRFTSDQIHVFRMRDGLIAEHWACRDDVSMMRQLGMLGEPAAVGSRT
jgi:predicted ester cyclase